MGVISCFKYCQIRKFFARPDALEFIYSKVIFSLSTFLEDIPFADKKIKHKIKRYFNKAENIFYIACSKELKITITICKAITMINGAKSIPPISVLIYLRTISGSL